MHICVNWYFELHKDCTTWTSFQKSATISNSSSALHCSVLQTLSFQQKWKTTVRCPYYFLCKYSVHHENCKRFPCSKISKWPVISKACSKKRWLSTGCTCTTLVGTSIFCLIRFENIMRFFAVPTLASTPTSSLSLWRRSSHFIVEHSLFLILLDQGGEWAQMKWENKT